MHVQIYNLNWNISCMIVNGFWKRPNPNSAICNKEQLLNYNFFAYDPLFTCNLTLQYPSLPTWYWNNCYIELVIFYFIMNLYIMITPLNIFRVVIKENWKKVSYFILYIGMYVCICIICSKLYSTQNCNISRFFLKLK